MIFHNRVFFSSLTATAHLYTVWLRVWRVIWTKRIFLVLWVLGEQSQLHTGFGDELVQLLLGLSEFAHLPLQLLVP